MSADVLDCFAYEGMKTTAPAMFELTLETPYENGGIKSEMFDLVRGNVKFEYVELYFSHENWFSKGSFGNQVLSSSQAVQIKYITQLVAHYIISATEEFVANNTKQ